MRRSETILSLLEIAFGDISRLIPRLIFLLSGLIICNLRYLRNLWIRLSWQGVQSARMRGRAGKG
ncbi:MAG TPA: hypothetical protein VM163_13490 [bacterium]|nr:hypothetical protein [bacterium]